MAKGLTRRGKAAAPMAEADPGLADAALQHAGPTDIADPLLVKEARRAAVWIGLVALLALAIYLSEALMIIFGGMVFAALIDGGARLLGRILPIGRGWRIALVLVLALSFIVWIVLFAGTQIAAQAAQLPGTLQAQALKMIDWLQAHGATINTQSMENLIEKLVGGVGQLTSAVGGVIGGFTTAFLIVVLGIYFAAEPQLYRRGFAWLLPVSEREHFEHTARIMGRTLRRLLAGRILGMVIEGIGTYILLSIYGVPMAGLLGLLTGLLAFLPNIGAPISGTLMILVGFSGGTNMGIYCIIVYLAIHIIDGNLIVPLIAKQAADLAPAVVLGAQLIMGTLFGILGLVLADPMVAMIKVLLERQSRRNEQA